MKRDSFKTTTNYGNIGIIMRCMFRSERANISFKKKCRVPMIKG